MPASISVITVTFNSGLFIRDCLESILASSFENFELIVADDCSTDNTWAIIQEFKDPRINAYRNETNLGEYANRNEAVKSSTGTYILFIDGDDMLYPWGLEYLVKMMDAFPECGFGLTVRPRNYLYYPVVLSSQKLYISEFFGYGFQSIALSHTVFRKEILERYNHFSEEIVNADDVIRMRIGADFPVLLMADQQTWWRERPGQATERHSKDPRAICQRTNARLSILKADFNPLTGELKTLACRNVIRNHWINILTALKRFQLHKAFFLYKNAPTTLSNIHYLLRRAKLIHPFQDYNSLAPYMVDCSRDPHRKKAVNV
ncbi:MAG: glycosyltransferase family 2 protein [Flavobacteriales bacterium]|nr:glycosyltransferase family 2 protein [Flavobacteriales bacterium]